MLRSLPHPFLRRMTLTQPISARKSLNCFNADSVFSDMLRQVNHLLETGKVRPLVGEVIPIAEAARAHEVLITGKVPGKIVLKV